jgi:hypothetical protein
MINFFRKIRKKLADDNKPLKYARYAIGEIFLVVIGILIALSINNWNDDRKTEVIKDAYKMSLIEDLTNDSTELEGTLYEFEIELNKLLAIGNRISNQSLSMDSIIKIYRLELSPLINATNNINRNTLDGLFATGNINLIEKDLYNSLMNLNDLQGKTIQTININLGFYMNYSTRVNLPFNDELSGIGGEPLENIWKNIDKAGFLRDFNAKLSSKILAYRTIIKARKELLRETESVLRKLSK